MRIRISFKMLVSPTFELRLSFFRESSSDEGSRALTIVERPMLPPDAVSVG